MGKEREDIRVVGGRGDEGVLGWIYYRFIDLLVFRKGFFVVFLGRGI